MKYMFGSGGILDLNLWTESNLISVCCPRASPQFTVACAMSILASRRMRAAGCKHFSAVLDWLLFPRARDALAALSSSLNAPPISDPKDAPDSQSPLSFDRFILLIILLVFFLSSRGSNNINNSPDMWYSSRAKGLTIGFSSEMFH